MKPTGRTVYVQYIYISISETNGVLQGEVDILEGVNDQGPNAATLHTGPGKRCNMRILANILNGSRRLHHASIARTDRVCLTYTPFPFLSD